MGVVGSLEVGGLIDRIGLEFCAALTLMVGQIQMLLILFGPTSEKVTILSFVFYSIFRSFLYPVFIGSLTSRLGFKYFGILLGFGFALSSIAQLLFPVLVSWLEGDCHLLEDAAIDQAAVEAQNCDHGNWQASEAVQFLILGALHIVPILDHRDAKERERQIREVLALQSPRKSIYGTNTGTESLDSEDF